jgi:radical SAM protein with 4Fe4S-binding SPASM domain
MTTNAILLNEEILESIMINKMHSLCISIDAATKVTYERIRVGSHFEKLISNIQAINKAKERLGSVTPYIQLNFVLMRSNIIELPAFVRLAHDLRASSVGAVHLVPFEGTNTKHESLVSHKSLCNQMLDEVREIGEKYNIIMNTPSNFSDATDTTLVAENNFFYALPVGEGEVLRSSCQFPWHWVGILPNGDVRPCGWWYNETATGKIEPPMGNIRLQSFEEIWNSESYTKLRSEHLTGRLRTTCRGCPAAGLGSVNNGDSFRVRRHFLCKD